MKLLKLLSVMFLVALATPSWAVFSPTSTKTVSLTRTTTPTATPSSTRTSTPTASPTRTSTWTASPTWTSSPTFTTTPTITLTPTAFYTQVANEGLTQALMNSNRQGLKLVLPADPATGLPTNKFNMAIVNSAGTPVATPAAVQPVGLTRGVSIATQRTTWFTWTSSMPGHAYSVSWLAQVAADAPCIICVSAARGGSGVRVDFGANTYPSSTIENYGGGLVVTGAGEQCWGPMVGGYAYIGTSGTSSPTVNGPVRGCEVK